MARQVADVRRAQAAAQEAQAQAAEHHSHVQALQASCSDYAHTTAAQADRLSEV